MRFLLTEVPGRAPPSLAFNEPDKATRYLAHTPTRLEDETT